MRYRVIFTIVDDDKIDELFMRFVMKGMSVQRCEYRHTFYGGYEWVPALAIPRDELSFKGWWVELQRLAKDAKLFTDSNADAVAIREPKRV